jgi:hypothetical protein
MLSSIRDVKGQGNAAVYVRARDATARFWDFVGLAWSASETSNCKTMLHEYQDADTAEARYQAAITPPSGDIVLEYVRAATALVIGEEGAQLAEVHASLLGRMVLNAGANTLTHYWPDGTVMAVYALTPTTTIVAPYVERTLA